MTRRSNAAPARSSSTQLYHRSEKWPFDHRDTMTKLWMSIVLWKYDLNDNQLEDMRDTLQLFCAEGIKAYRASKSLLNKQN